MNFNTGVFPFGPNLWSMHQSVETTLKAFLYRLDHTPAELKKICHNINRLWKILKEKVSVLNKFDEFDSFIENLNNVNPDIRYAKYPESGFNEGTIYIFSVFIVLLRTMIFNGTNKDCKYYTFSKHNFFLLNRSSGKNLKEPFKRLLHLYLEHDRYINNVGQICYRKIENIKKIKEIILKQPMLQCPICHPTTSEAEQHNVDLKLVNLYKKYLTFIKS